MKKILKKSIAILLSLLMLSTGLVSAFADDNNCKLELNNKAYFGVQNIATATISGLDLDKANEIKENGLTWETDNNSICTKITPTGTTTPQYDESTKTYTVTETATVDFAKATTNTRPNITVTAKYQNEYICSNSFTVNIPIDTIAIKHIESENKNAYFNESSSTLYIDSGTNTAFSVTSKPADNDDKIITKQSDPINITCTNTSNQTYKIIVKKDAKVDNTIEFGTDSGSGSVKRIKVKKCVPTSRIRLQVNSQYFADSNSSSLIPDYSLPGVVDGDIVTVNTLIDNASNDTVKYTIYKDENLSESSIDTKSKIEYTNKGCNINFVGSGTRYVLAQAQSLDDSGLDRTVKTVMVVPVDQAKKITKINIDTSKKYTIYTLNKQTLDISKEITTEPADNYTDSIYYYSSNTNVATVNEKTGIVTAKNAGTTTISIVAKRGENVSYTATCEVTVKTAVNKIDINLSNVAENDDCILPVGHKKEVLLTINPTDAEENISLTSSDPDVLSVQGNTIVALKESETPVTLTAQSDSGTIARKPITIVPAVRATKLTLEPKAVKDTVIVKDQNNDNEYSIYSGQSVNIECFATDDNSNKSNDIIEWRVTVNNSVPMTIEEAKASGKIANAVITNNILTITSSSTSNDTIVVTAYAIMEGEDIENAKTTGSVTINNNTKTNRITVSNGTNHTMPCDTSYSDTIKLEPNVSFNKDSIYVESTNPDIASVEFSQGKSNKEADFTVTANSNGTTQICIYACAVEGDKSTAVCTLKIKITVTNNIEKATVTGNDNVVYNGKAQTQKLTVMYGDIELREKTDYTLKYANNTNVGKATVTITGKNNYYQGTKTVYFNILPKNIENAGITVANVTYNANEQKPNVTVKDKDRNVNLAKNKDYTVTYQNNVNAGTASVIITGINNYTGTAVQSFTISTLDITKAKINAIPNQSYVGASVTPVPTITYANRQLTNGVDFTVTYSNNNFPGTGKATITGIGNFKGSKELTFKIVGDISKATVTGLSPITQTGKAITVANFPAFRVSLGKDLVANTDYTLAYANNTLPGIATITITGKGSYTGKLTVNFTINKKSSAPSGATKVSGDYVNKKYKKANISSLKKGKKSITVKWKKVKSIKGYQIEYSTSKKFTKKTSKKVLVSKQKKTSTAIKNLKAKKKYYVRIRTYKNVKFNGKTVKVYSKWSKSKSVKTK